MVVPQVNEKMDYQENHILCALLWGPLTAPLFPFVLVPAPTPTPPHTGCKRA